MSILERLPKCKLCLGSLSNDKLSAKCSQKGLGFFWLELSCCVHGKLKTQFLICYSLSWPVVLSLYAMHQLTGRMGLAQKPKSLKPYGQKLCDGAGWSKALPSKALQVEHVRVITA